MKKQFTAAMIAAVYIIVSVFSGNVFAANSQETGGIKINFDGTVKNEESNTDFSITPSGELNYIADRYGKKDSAVRFTNGGGIGIKEKEEQVDYTGDFSVAMWVNPSYIEADTPIIGNMNWYQDGSWGKQGWQLYFDTTTKAIIFYAVGMDENGNSTKNGCVRNLGMIPYHEWTHIAVVFNAAEKQVYYYRNGELFSIMNIGAEVWNFNCPLNGTKETKLGNNGNKETYQTSNVSYDDFILEKRAIPAEEIYELGKMVIPQPKTEFSFEDNLKDTVSGTECQAANLAGSTPDVTYMENGVDGKAVKIQNGNHLDLGERDWSDSFTVSMWINPEESKTDSPIMGNLNWENVGDGGWILAFAGNSLPTGLRFTAKQDNTSRVDLRSTAEIPKGQWTHIAVSCNREDGIAKLYVNGVLNQEITSEGLKGGSLQTANHTRIGQDGTGSYRTDKAVSMGYDNVKIFNCVLGEEQLKKAAASRGIQSFAAAEFHFDGQHENSVKDGFSITPWNGFDDKQPSFEYVDGRSAKAVRLAQGNHFDISNMDVQNSFSIAAWIKAQENPTDCPIIGNMNWNNVAAGGWLLAFPGGGLPKNLKFVVKQDKTSRVDIKTTAEIPKDIWTHVAVSYNRAQGRVKIYVNGVLDQDVTDEKLKGGSLESGLSARLGQDGTGVYAPKARMDLCMDELNIYKTVLTDAEVEQMVMKDSKQRFDLCWVAGEQATADSYYTANLHVLTPDDYSRYSKAEFDVSFDPEKMRFAHSAMHNFGFAVDTTDEERGILHCKITPDRSLAANVVSEYSGSRVAKLTFEVKAQAQGTMNLEIPKQSIQLKNKAASDITAQTDVHADSVPVTILQPLEQDKNKDGVVGIGDVALAANQEEAKKIAEQAKIYPYKRVLMIVLDGGGVSLSPNAYHYTVDGEELGRFGVDGYPDIRNNPYAIDLMNNQCATTFTMQTVHPSWSAPNYTAFLHGFRVYGSSATNPFFCGNEEAGNRYFNQYDAQDGSDKPSIYKVLRRAMPERTLYSAVQWESITSGIMEPNLGTGTESAPNDRQVTDKLTAYMNSSKMKNTVLTFVQWDDVDHSGHQKGFFTDAYYKTVAEHDALYKEVVETLDASGYADDTFVIFTADHGGHETGHGADLPCTRNTMFAVKGQTVEAGRKLNDEGDTSDAPAVILNALRRDELKPESMKFSNGETGNEPAKESAAFDPNMFMSQKELSSKGRDIEKLTLQNSYDGARLKISNTHQETAVTAVQAVLEVPAGAKDISVTPAQGCSVLSSQIENGKMNLVITKDQPFTENETIAVINGNELELYEAMLGSNEGKELYCDIASEDGYTVIFQNQQGDTITEFDANSAVNAVLSVKEGETQNGWAVLASFKDGALCSIKSQKAIDADNARIVLTLSKEEIKQADCIKFFFLESASSMKPLTESRAIPKTKN